MKKKLHVVNPSLLKQGSYIYLDNNDVSYCHVKVEETKASRKPHQTISHKESEGPVNILGHVFFVPHLFVIGKKT